MDGWVLFFFIVVGIPVIAGVFGDFSKRWLKLKEKQLELAASEAAERAATATGQVERLEQRVRVLERIATDGGAHLAAEIEDLRRDRASSRPQ
ncbi:hypothetical protein [Pacificimonas flava]|uniref:Phage shock protein B n=1 Tax=Pacificimonas flava TaxID=1234595 RepID=M2SC55_9SPHN|nr:hypothetical protein [Pacificimonas flava]EMD82950.1 hypothetical protein C725_1548 [Pacificimonas flava]MBB5280110.1 hypothetical protein [Pacificimonas flava]